jgi:hypothetical protein
MPMTQEQALLIALRATYRDQRAKVPMTTT